MCWDSWGRRESDTTERLNRTEHMHLCMFIDNCVCVCVCVTKRIVTKVLDI